MTQETIRLPRSSYEELRKIIVAYGMAGEGVSLDDIAARTGMSRTAVSGNNAFLSSVGIVEGAKSKTITSQGMELSTALQHELGQEIARHWRMLIEENDFLSKMVQAVSIRQGMEPSQFESHIAYSAGESRSPKVMTGSRAVIDILTASGLIQEKDGQLVATKPSELPSDVADTSVAPEMEQVIATHTPGQVPVVVQIQIQAKPDDLDGLSTKLKAFIDSLSEDLNQDSSGSASSED